MLITGKAKPSVKKGLDQATGQSTDGAQANPANSAANGASQQNAAGGAAAAALTTEGDVFMSALLNVEALQTMINGKPCQYTSAVRPINDSTAEYVVSTVKHFYEELVIVQYGIKNTLDDQLLSGVTLKIENFITESGLTVKGVIPLAEGDQIRVAE